MRLNIFASNQVLTKCFFEDEEKIYAKDKENIEQDFRSRSN